MKNRVESNLHRTLMQFLLLCVWENGNLALFGLNDFENLGCSREFDNVADPSLGGIGPFFWVFLLSIWLLLFFGGILRGSIQN